MVLDIGCIFALPPSLQNTMATEPPSADGPHVNLYVEMETVGNEFWQVLSWNIIMVVAAVYLVWRTDCMTDCCLCRRRRRCGLAILLIAKCGNNG